LPSHKPLADLHGTSRLAVDAARGVTGLVESMHATIAGVAGLVPGADVNRTRGITGLVYRCVDGAMQLAGGGLDLALRPLAGLAEPRASAPARDTVLGILNGVLGDHLEASGNPLAVGMTLRHDGRVVDPCKSDLRAALPRAGGKILLQIHGLCMSQREWARGGVDHCAEFAPGLGYTVLRLNYNTGRRIAENGRSLAALLEALDAAWPVPVEEIAIVAHSMGGLVARSAQHHAAAAGQAWPERLRKLVFLGTPQHGAPLERAGNRFDWLLGLTPYTLPFTRLGKVRSAGITDLRYGSLLDDDWQGVDRYARVPAECRRPVPLPAGVDCFAVAAVRAAAPGAPAADFYGDGLVPLASALGEHPDPRYELGIPARARWIGTRLGHLELLSDPGVFAQVRRWLES